MVLARKYRPKKLSELIGQPTVVQTLSNALTQKKLHHAYLFAGNFGCGKTSAARILAASENCKVTEDVLHPCGSCELCKAVFAGTHSDVSEIDAASHAGKVDQIRELKTAASYAPMDGARSKYYIIDECLPADALVTMSDGSQSPIGELVENSSPNSDQSVKSRDMATGDIIDQKICRYIKIPNDKQMYEVKIKDKHGDVRILRITGNHSVFVHDKGQKIKAEDLKVGQKVWKFPSARRRAGMTNVVKRLWDSRFEMGREVKLSGFCHWLNRKAKDLTCIEDLEALDLPLAMSVGTVRFPGHKLQDNQASWRAVGYHPNLRLGEIFSGTGRNAFEALVTSLMTAYEMIMYRKGR